MIQTNYNYYSTRFIYKHDRPMLSIFSNGSSRLIDCTQSLKSLQKRIELHNQEYLTAEQITNQENQLDEQDRLLSDRIRSFFGPSADVENSVTMYISVFCVAMNHSIEECKASSQPELRARAANPSEFYRLKKEVEILCDQISDLLWLSRACRDCSKEEFLELRQIYTDALQYFH